MKPLLKRWFRELRPLRGATPETKRGCGLELWERSIGEDKESDRPLSQPIVEFLGIIQQTPREYWPNLLKMMRLFLETVTVKPVLSEPAPTPEKIDITKLSLEERIKRNQGAIDLINSWIEDGDEQEQTETWEYLRKVLDEDRLSNRLLFP